MVRRTKTMELRAIRAQMSESIPPAPSGTTIREWFAGLAMSNSELMKEIPVELRAREAVRLADELVAALAPPSLPSPESMKGEFGDELETDFTNKGKEMMRHYKTNPEVPIARIKKLLLKTPRFSTLPPPLTSGRYSSVAGDDEEGDT